MRASGLLVVIFTCWLGSAAYGWHFEAMTTAAILFTSSPPGAQVINCTADGQHLLGLTGQPVTVHIPASRDERLVFKIHLDGYSDESMELDTAQLRGQRMTQVPVTLTATSPLVPVAAFVRDHGVLLGTLGALALLSGAGAFLWTRSLKRRSRVLHTLIPQAARQADSNVGNELGGYLLLRQLGRGGAATVYAGVDATNVTSREHVAVKLMNRSVITPEFRSRFTREVSICKSLNHPNLVRLIDWGDGEFFYLVMEMVEGHSLRRYIGMRGMQVDEALGLLHGIFAGLTYAHGRGIVHCDLKPENIMVTPAGQIRIMDFGIATGTEYGRLTRTRDVMGTPGYLAPEQMDGVRNDPRSDEYALGVIIFEMLTGQAPFEHEDPMIRMTLHLAETPPRISDIRPAVPEAVSDVVDRMLAKTPDERYASLQDAWDDLARSANWAAFSLQQKTVRLTLVEDRDDETAATQRMPPLDHDTVQHSPGNETVRMPFMDP